MNTNNDGYLVGLYFLQTHIGDQYYRYAYRSGVIVAHLSGTHLVVVNHIPEINDTEKRQLDISYLTVGKWRLYYSPNQWHADCKTWEELLSAEVAEKRQNKTKD